MRNICRKKENVAEGNARVAHNIFSFVSRNSKLQNIYR